MASKGKGRNKKDVTFNQYAVPDMALHERNILLQFYKPLTENIKSEDVVGKLVQRGVLSHEEKNRISLAPRNLERMKLVLELIPKKNGNAFEKFLDVIKYKYTSLYDQLTKAKQAPFVEEKPDEMTQCANALRSHYIHMWSKLTPIPWHKTATTTFSDFFEAPYITDYNGQAYSIEELFDGHKKVEHPRKILIEGVSGTGKSFIGKHIAFKYTQGHDVFNKAEFRLLFYIDLRKMKGSLSEAILEQCLPASYSSSPEEITTMLESNQQDILFIFDGYEDLKTESNDIWEVIEKKLLPKCAVILMVNPELFNISFRKYFETKLTLLGLKPDNQEDLIRKYADITQHSHDTFTSLLAKLINEYDNTVRLLSLNPLCCLCLCLIIETQGSLEIHTLSSMLQNFALAIQKLNCQHRKITIVNGNIPDDIQLAMSALEVTAFNTAMARDTVFPMDRLQTLSEYQTTENLFHFGLLETYFHHQAGSHGRGKEMVVFCNRLVQESLVARRLSQMELEDCVQYVEDLTTESHLAQIAVFYCGHHQYDQDLHLMRELFDKLGHKNRQHWKILPATTNGSLSSGRDLNQESEGRLEDFKLSLECLNESEGRREVIALITESLPRRLGARHKDFQTIQLIGGLAHVIMADTCVVSELDLRLDHVGAYQEHTMMQLADALEKSLQVSTLRIQWTREDLLASFLANVFGENQSITTLKISDESKSDAKNISATIWSHLRSAGNRMIHIRDLAFNHCKNPALNSSLMRNLQGDFHTLNLKGCKIDLVGAQNLAARIEKSKIMQVLNLDSVKMSSADFLNVTYGLRLNRSVTDLSLIDNHFDNAKVAALTDGLKFNGTLKRIDLSHNTFSEEHCKAIGQALGANKSMSDVKMKDCKLSEDGARSLRKLKRDGVVLSGLGDKGLMSKYAFGPGSDLSASPDIEKKPSTKK